MSCYFTIAQNDHKKLKWLVKCFGKSPGLRPKVHHVLFLPAQRAGRFFSRWLCFNWSPVLRFPFRNVSHLELAWLLWKMCLCLAACYRRVKGVSQLVCHCCCSSSGGWQRLLEVLYYFSWWLLNQTLQWCTSNPYYSQQKCVRHQVRSLSHALKVNDVIFFTAPKEITQCQKLVQRIPGVFTVEWSAFGSKSLIFTSFSPALCCHTFVHLRRSLQRFPNVV